VICVLNYVRQYLYPSKFAAATLFFTFCSNFHFNRVQSEEEEKLQREDKKKNISRELSQITQAIRNLFGRCFSTMRIKPVYQGQKDTASPFELLEYELDIIHMRITDLIEIHKDYKQAMLLEHSSHNNNNSLPQPPPMSAGGTGAGGVDLKEASMMSVGTTGAAVSTSSGHGKGR